MYIPLYIFRFLLSCSFLLLIPYFMAYLSSLEVLHQLKTTFSFSVPLSVIQPLSDFPILSAGPKPGEMESVMKEIQS